MSTAPRRYRSSTSASIPQATSKSAEVLRGLLDGVVTALRISDTDTEPQQQQQQQQYPDPSQLTRLLLQIRQHILALPTPNATQDDFRHLFGFNRMLDMLRAFSGFYDPRKRSAVEVQSVLDLLGAVLNLLAAAFDENPGNKRAFRYRIEGGGWDTLEQALACVGFGGPDTQGWTYFQLFGKLLSFALGEDHLDEICRSISDLRLQDDKSESSSTDGFDHISHREATENERHEDDASPETRPEQCITPTSRLRHPEILRAVVGFWESIPRVKENPAATDPSSVMVLDTLLGIISVSVFNRAALHATGALSRFLRIAFAPKRLLDGAEYEKTLEICKALMSLGMDDPADTQFLLSSSVPGASEFCLQMASLRHLPPTFHFDLSLHGYCAIKLGTLGRAFPPQSSPGYTLTAWIRVEQFDPGCHTTIFGLYDSTQTCFLLVYLEMDTRNFILQTSVTSPKPSVRFKALRFAEKRWYHIALVHRRHKAMTGSKAYLYVNGELADQAKCNYPVPPPLSTASAESFASFTTTGGKTNPVQVVLGTPKELSNHSGSGVVFSKWSLASAHLIEDILSDDFLAVHYGLGPEYQGNFQDSLGSFQTYEASAILGLRSEANGAGKEDKSDIAKAIRDKAGALLPEHKILLSILPTAVFRSDVHFQDTALLRNLPKPAAKRLRELARRSESPIAINVSVAYLPDTLLRPHGLAVLKGGPVVLNPSCFDTNLWRLGGFTAVALKILERAVTGEETVRAVEIMFKSIQHSWRNSEAMERDSGYNILGTILRAKLGFTAGIGAENGISRLVITPDERDRIGLQLLSLILGFVGYHHVKPAESLIVNQFAYRILLIDLDIWRKMAPLVQQLYYKQFVTFVSLSKYRDFNGRRLQRMRIVKRLLDAFKGESLYEEVLPHFVSAFTCLVKSNCSKEIMKYLALFITYSLHHSSLSSVSRTPKSVNAFSRSSTPTRPRRPTIEINGAAVVPGSSPTYLTRKQLGTKILGIYSDILCEKGDRTLILRFTQTVTNRWLLYLLTEDDPEVVVHGTKVLARVLVTQGPGYTTKFAGKPGGFTIMAHRLKRWWDIPTLWPICFSILFGLDVAEIAFARNFDFFSLLEMFAPCKVVYGDAILVLTSMLKHGLKDVLSSQNDPDSPPAQQQSMPDALQKPPRPAGRRRAGSMELSKALETRSLPPNDELRLALNTGAMQTVIRFLSDLYTRSMDFRDFALSSEYVRMLLAALYPAIVSADPVSPEMELNSGETPLTFDGGDVIIRPLTSHSAAPVVRSSTVTITSPQPLPQRGTPLRKASSFILLTPQKPSLQPARPARSKTVPITKSNVVGPQSVKSDVVEGLMELVITVFVDQVLVRKEFPGFGLFFKIPPGFQEHQAYFESYILRNTIAQLENDIQMDKKVLCEPRVLTNMARFHVHVTESIFEGRFMSGAEPMIDFAGSLLEYLQQPEIANLKSVRLCSQSVCTVRSCFLKLILLRLSDINDDANHHDQDAVEFMTKILYWQTSVLGGLSNDDECLKLMCYQLYTKLIDKRPSIRAAAANILRILLVQKPEETTALLRHCTPPDQGKLVDNFRKLEEIDDETFVEWVDENRAALDTVFLSSMAKPWEDYVGVENRRTTEMAGARLAKRRERLKAWKAEKLQAENALLRHELSNASWTKMIHNSEHYKHQRLLQDQQDDLAFMLAGYAKMETELRRPGAVFSEAAPVKWKLDQTEGRNRMRLRLMPDYSSQHEEYQPKRKGSETATATATAPALASASASASASAAASVRASTSVSKLSSIQAQPLAVVDPLASIEVQEASASLEGIDEGREKEDGGGLTVALSTDGAGHSAMPSEDDFEIVDDPAEADDAFEDKNRKVMRQLERGDAVQAAYNVSRIIGLEACEGICIIGKEALYIMDNVFQGATGEIVNVWDAPAHERDPFSQIVTDIKTSERRQHSGRKEQDSRSWRWHDVISMSKRRFLFRDVAIEVFFTDGRSYLLAAINPAVRDELFGKLLAKAPHTSAASSLPNPEDGWRLEVVKALEESPQGFGSRFGSIFTSSPSNPMMRRWQRGETSNFHYLMMVNTMAGRTFNDLTQYPVFPWVLADYTSDELDLDDPKTFRDLSKPMGAQTPARVAGFNESYSALEEIGETPFHYGTHYSSAMIVSSYLIRLPPFVQSYMLLQGGSFDHADRLFQSIPAAWTSASRDNKTDVRELIPEFFCLPEFLTNINGYNFGSRQSDGGRVDDVQLPPWAKGDPRIFITKHREALESPFVSRNLHSWIDLVFGYKQRGEAAVENLNVFHHLSYRGAADLDNMTDPKERAIAAGVIHNFGQTPHQVFSRPHPPREVLQCPPARRLDTAVPALGLMPNPILESADRVASLIYAPKLDRLLCAPPFRVNFSPYDKYLEWGYADNSVRFFLSDNRRPAGLCEGLHTGQLSAVCFADAKTLITAGEDCVIAVHTVQTALGKPVDLVLRSSLFGHKTPVRVTAVSKAFSTLVSVSEDGQAFVWDLNQLKFVRRLPLNRPVECARVNGVTGDVMLCSGRNVLLYTLNGSLLLEQCVCAPGDDDDWVRSCAFYEGVGSEWLASTLIFTGHGRGRVNVWKKAVGPDGKWTLEALRRLDHPDPRGVAGANVEAAITCIAPEATCVYTGDEEGRVFEWNFHQRDR